MGRKRKTKNTTNPLGFFKFLDDLGSEARELEGRSRAELLLTISRAPELRELVKRDDEDVVELLAELLIVTLACADTYTNEFGTVVAMSLQKRRVREQ